MADRYPLLQAFLYYRAKLPHFAYMSSCGIVAHAAFLRERHTQNNENNNNNTHANYFNMLKVEAFVDSKNNYCLESLKELRDNLLDLSKNEIFFIFR